MQQQFYVASAADNDGAWVVKGAQTPTVFAAEEHDKAEAFAAFLNDVHANGRVKFAPEPTDDWTPTTEFSVYGRDRGVAQFGG